MGHTCEYAPPDVHPSKRKHLQQELLPAPPVIIWTEADSLRSAYYHTFQRHDPVGLSTSDAIAQVVPREGFSDDVFHHICMSLGALSLSPVARFRASCDEQSVIPVEMSSPYDAHHAKAIRYYTTALTLLRVRLGAETTTLSPRTLLLSMSAMAYFEILQGDVVAGCHLQLNCFSVLGDAIILQAQNGDLQKFGLKAMYKGDSAIEEMEALHIRLAAMGLLGSPDKFVRTGRRILPIPRPSLGGLPQPDDSTEMFRTSWNAFAQGVESWRLACYWAICLNGTSASLLRFLDDQHILVECLRAWEKVIESRIGLTRCLSFGESHLQVLKVLLIYVRSMQLILAPEDDDTKKVESLHATDMAQLAELPVRTMSRFLGGFLFGSWNDFSIDSQLLPMIKFTALKKRRGATSINLRLAQLQLGLGDAIWSIMKQYYDRSRSRYNSGYPTADIKLSWTFTWWKHNRDIFESTISSLILGGLSHSSDVHTSGSNGEDKVGSMASRPCRCEA